MKIIKSNKSDLTKTPVLGAEDDFEFFEDEPSDVAFDDDFDDVGVDDIPKSSDDGIEEDEEDEDIEEFIDEDEVSIEVDNNISNHYIAECDICKGVFITSVVESDLKIEMLSGLCPICGKESDMYLKWLVKDIDV